MKARIRKCTINTKNKNFLHNQLTVNDRYTKNSKDSPSQDCICRKLEKQDRQDGRSDQLQSIIAPSHLQGRKNKKRISTS